MTVVVLPLSSQTPVLLGVCYDRGILTRRLDVLQGTNVVGIPDTSFRAASEAMETAKIDIMVLCAEVPEPDRTRVTELFRTKHPEGSVVWVQPDDAPKSKLVDGYCKPDHPDEMRQLMMRLLSMKRR